MSDTIYVYGIINGRRTRIKITNPQTGDRDYAIDFYNVITHCSAAPLRNNMEIEQLDTYDVHKGAKVQAKHKKNIVFIKLIDPSIEDIKYTHMLMANWNNYYKPENYILPNATITHPWS